MQNHQTSTGAVGSERFRVVIYSFGFKHGVPIDANLVLDARCLPNPYWQESLRPLCGLDRPVADYVVQSEAGQGFLSALEPLLHFYIATGQRGTGNGLRIAVGCTGGRHRSVAVVEALKNSLASEAIDLLVFHRDVDRTGS